MSTPSHVCVDPATGSLAFILPTTSHSPNAADLVKLSQYPACTASEQGPQTDPTRAWKKESGWFLYVALWAQLALVWKAQRRQVAGRASGAEHGLAPPGSSRDHEAPWRRNWQQYASMRHGLAVRCHIDKNIGVDQDYHRYYFSSARFVRMW